MIQCLNNDRFLESGWITCAFQRIKTAVDLLILGAVYFGSRKLRKGGISPLLLLCLALAGMAAYGI